MWNSQKVNRLKQNKICPICGNEIKNAAADCPKMGSLVCEKCHTACEHMDKSTSLWHCMFLRKGGVDNK